MNHTMTTPLPDPVLDQLFRTARTFNRFDGRAVSDAQISALYDLLKWGPTAFNSQPGRYLFIRSPEAKARLAPAVSNSNREKTLAAPLNVVLAYDSQFYEHLPRFTASPNAKALFETYPALIEPTALRSGSLQGAYLILAARALGLDVGVLTGFDADKLATEFFPDGRYKPNFVANIGYGDRETLQPRAQRFEFAEVAEVL